MKRNKKLKFWAMSIFLLTFGMSLFSCVEIATSVIQGLVELPGAAIQDVKQNSAIKNEASQLNGRNAKWRSELAYNKNKKGETLGTWYGINIPGWSNESFLQVVNLDNGVSTLNIWSSQRSGYAGTNYALVSSDDQPAGEISSIILKELGSTDYITYIVSYFFSTDGSSLTITDLGGLNHPLLKTGTYINSDAKKSANEKILEGYGALTVANISSEYSITMISVDGGRDIKFSKTYQVNLRPAASGIAGIMGGGSFDVGDIILGKKVVPIGDYVITIRWSNGAQSTDRLSVSSRGITTNVDQY